MGLIRVPPCRRCGIRQSKILFPPADSTFYEVSYADGAVSVSRELSIEQWKLHVKGAASKPMLIW